MTLRELQILGAAEVLGVPWAQNRPSSPHIGRNRPQIGPNSPVAGRPRPSLGRTYGTPAKNGTITLMRPTFRKRQKTGAAKVGRNWPTNVAQIDRHRPRTGLRTLSNLAQHWQNSAECGPNLANLATLWSALAQNLPNSPEAGRAHPQDSAPGTSRIATKFGGTQICTPTVL